LKSTELKYASGSVYVSTNVIGGDNKIGPTWATPANITGEADSAMAVISNFGNSPSSSISQYIVFGNYGFNVPTNASIHGIELQLTRVGGTISVLDNDLKLPPDCS